MKSNCCDAKILTYFLLIHAAINIFAAMKHKYAVFSFTVSVFHEEMDDEDCERRRGECLDEMLDLEKQFQELKDK